MNGFGSGSCSFTNTGNAEGAICGKIIVSRHFDQKKIESNYLCSGAVAPSATNKVEFSIPGTNDLCTFGSTPWGDHCDFDFSGSAETEPSIPWMFLLITAGVLLWFVLPEVKRLFTNKTRKCSFCAEQIKVEALICKHCGKEISAPDIPKVPKSWWKRQSIVRKAIILYFSLLLIVFAATVLMKMVLY